MISEEKIVEAALQKFPGDDIEVVDTRGTQDHYSIQIVSKQFAGKSLVEQHRMVQAAISPLFNEGLHAIEIFTKVPK